MSFQVIFKRHYSTVSDADKGTLFADRNVINRRNVTADVHSNWAHCKAFAILEVKARIIAAAITVLGMQNINDQPKHNSYISLKHGTDQEKKHYLMKISGQIVDQFVLDKHALNSFLDSVLSAQEQDDIVNNQNLTADGRFPCRQPGCNKSFKHDGKRRRDHELTHDPPPVIPEKPALSATYPKKALSSVKNDDVFNYNCSLLSQGLLFMDFLDATSEGDGERSIRCWKFFLLHFKEEKSTTKYALEALYLLLQVHSLLPPAEAHSLVWNRTVNNKGGPGKNVALDLDMEHDNKDIKTPIKNLGPNVTEAAVRRISQGQQKSKKMLTRLDREITVKQRSGKHVSADYTKDLTTVTNLLIEEKVFQHSPGRQYKFFTSFARDPLSRLDMSSLYQWIKGHTKNIALGRKAR